MKHFFVYTQTSSDKPAMAIYHGDDPRDKKQDVHLRAPILGTHEIPEHMNERIERGECPWAELKEMFPPPVQS